MTSPKCSHGTAREYITEIMEMTRRMQQLVAGSSWDELLLLQELRDRRLQELFTNPVPEDDRTWIAAAVGEILQADRQMDAACRQAHENVRSELSTITQGKRAARAYQQP